MWDSMVQFVKLNSLQNKLHAGSLESTAEFWYKFKMASSSANHFDAWRIMEGKLGELGPLADKKQAMLSAVRKAFGKDENDEISKEEFRKFLDNRLVEEFGLKLADDNSYTPPPTQTVWEMDGLTREEWEESVKRGRESRLARIAKLKAEQAKQSE